VADIWAVGLANAGDTTALGQHPVAVHPVPAAGLARLWGTRTPMRMDRQLIWAISATVVLIVFIIALALYGYYSGSWEVQ